MTVGDVRICFHGDCKERPRVVDLVNQCITECVKARETQEADHKKHLFDFARENATMVYGHDVQIVDQEDWKQLTLTYTDACVRREAHKVNVKRSLHKLIQATRGTNDDDQRVKVCCENHLKAMERQAELDECVASAERAMVNSVCIDVMTPHEEHEEHEKTHEEHEETHEDAIEETHEDAIEDAIEYAMAPHADATVLLCDGCNGEWPLTQLGLDEVPDGTWYCPTCYRRCGRDGCSKLCFSKGPFLTKFCSYMCHGMVEKGRKRGKHYIMPISLKTTTQNKKRKRSDVTHTMSM